MPSDANAAERLALIADALAARGVSPRGLLRGLAWNCAGIRPDLRGIADLASGGRNRFPGRGFRRPFDDHTDGQARHFAGIAVSPLLLGEPLARFAARHVLQDPADSADGRLSEAAFDFSRRLRQGSLQPSQAGEWIRGNLRA